MKKISILFIWTVLLVGTFLTTASAQTAFDKLESIKAQKNRETYAKNNVFNNTNRNVRYTNRYHTNYRRSEANRKPHHYHRSKNYNRYNNLGKHKGWYKQKHHGKKHR